MNKPFDWDLFLSHSSIDKPRVARLAERLTAAGFRVWVAPTGIAHGQDVFKEIEDGLERSPRGQKLVRRAEWREPSGAWFRIATRS